MHTSSAEISENLITENDMLLEKIPELLVDDDETKTNNTNFEPPPEPLYCKLCEPDEKNQQVYFAKNVTAICVIVALMIIIISN